MTPIYLEDHRPAAKRTRRTLLMLALVVAVMLVAAVWTSAKAQVQTARVTTKDSVRITVVSTRKVDTLIRVVHDTIFVPVKPPVTPPSDTTPTPPIVIPPPSSGSPAPQPGDVTILSDNFDTKTDTTICGAGRYACAGSVKTVSPGYGATGKALRFAYTPGSDDNLIEKSFGAATNFYVKYRFRVSAGWLPNSERTGSGMKWFMPWRDGAPRYTAGVGKLTNPNWQFTIHDNSSGDIKPDAPSMLPFYKSTAKKLTDVNDGQWHEYALHVVTGAGGYEEIWVDGLLTFSSRGNTFNHDAAGIALFQFPGLVVDGIPDAARSGTVDVDDLLIWKR